MATNNKKIVIVGSSNTDLVVRVEHFPQAGETIMGSDFMTAQGGKGANQAVAVARLGGEAVFVARLGNDAFGEVTLAALRSEGIDTRHVTRTEGVASGVATITVDKSGENCIVVAGGANMLLSPEDIAKAAEEIRSASLLLMQLETPLPALIEAARLAHENGVKVVLNPAPYPKQPLPMELLQNVDIIIPNETEAAYMTGIQITDDDSAIASIRKIQSMGVKEAIITVGKQGAYTLSDNQLVRVPAVAVQAVDTTAAGDTFCGALCVALTKGMSMTDAIALACKAASISVTRRGAQPSVPTAAEVF
ncbi:MAG: ribokinase [Bacteroidaceae bacterium]|nr:ribokinase [Bacteroidaceae bacterium]MBP5731500.1 ribokinase [Bacteroidaceae bacterium]